MCKACENDSARDYEREICRRVHSTTPQWWEREPGYFADEVDAIRRAARRHAPALPKLPKVKALCHYTVREIAVELDRQSKRLAKAELGTWETGFYKGAKAAERYVEARRQELGLDATLVAA